MNHAPNVSAPPVGLSHYAMDDTTPPYPNFWLHIVSVYWVSFFVRTKQYVYYSIALALNASIMFTRSSHGYNAKRLSKPEKSVS